MKLNKKISHDEEADLRELIIKLWKKKILIFLMSLVFIALGLIYGTLQPKIYKTTIKIREAPHSLFEEYRSVISFAELNFLNERQSSQVLLSSQIAEQFNNEFKLQLLSIDSIVEFVEQNTELEYLKSFLSKKKVSMEVYFEDKFKKEKNSINSYSLVYRETFLEKKFLDNYIIFIKNKTEKIFKQQLIQVLNKRIQFHNYNLEVIEKTNFENSKLSFPSNSSFKLSKEELLQNILFLEQYLNETKNLKLNYDPILVKASSPKEISITWHSYILFGFAFGFLFSLLIIFLKKDY